MESTAKYWVPVRNVLEDASINVVIANPKWVSAVKGNKDDKTKDAVKLLVSLGLVPEGSISGSFSWVASFSFGSLLAGLFAVPFGLPLLVIDVFKLPCQSNFEIIKPQPLSTRSCHVG